MKKIFLLGMLILFLGLISCTTEQGAITEAINEEYEILSNGVSAPIIPENTSHGYLLDDDRIPEIPNCEKWAEFWTGSEGPAVSYEARNTYPLNVISVSTQIYVKNLHLDTNLDGVLCFNESATKDELAKSNGSYMVSALSSITPRNILSSAVTCKLSDTESVVDSQGWGLGFPLSRNALNTTGRIDVKVIFVDFLDIKDSTTDLYEFFEELKIAEDFFSMASYGNLDFNLEIHPNRILLENKMGDFGMQEDGPGDNYQYLQSAIAASDVEIDFSTYEAVIIIPPVDAGEIAQGPIGLFPPGYGIKSEEKEILVGATAGSGEIFNIEPWIWVAHEFGHALGLPHIYNDVVNGGVTIHDVMYWGGYSSDFVAWNKWRLGWITDNQVRCLSVGDSTSAYSTHKLTPLSLSDKNEKVLLVMLNDYQLLALEYRTFSSLDDNTNWKEGLFVYQVDLRSSWEAPKEIEFPGISPQIKDFASEGKWFSTITTGEFFDLRRDDFTLKIEVNSCTSEFCDFEMFVDKY